MTERLKQNEEAEKGDDISVAMELCKHIDNPCEAEIAPGQVANLRSFWIAEAKRFTEVCENPFAKELVEDKIKKYEK